MWGLADATDMSVDQVWKAIQALSVYGKVDTGIDEFTDQLELLNEEVEFLSTTDTGKLAVNYEKLLSFAQEGGMSSDQWKSMKNWLYLLNEIGEVEIQNVPDVEGGWQNYNDLVENTAENAEQAKKNAETVKETLEEAATVIEGTQPPDLSEAAGGQDEGQELLEQYKDIL